jgi:hypothetical protein
MINDIIARLKATVPMLKLVGGAADFQAAVEANPPATPAVFVIPVEDMPGARFAADVTMQRVTATVGLVLVVRNLADKHGAAASTDMEVLRQAVKDQVFGWQAKPELDPFERGPGKHLAFRDGHVWWQDTLVTSYIDRSKQ